MRDGLTMVQDTIQTLVETLVRYGVVCTMAADGVLLLELYSLLECLQPEVTICQSDSVTCGLYRRGLRYWAYIWSISRCQMS